MTDVNVKRRYIKKDYFEKSSGGYGNYASGVTSTHTPVSINPDSISSLIIDSNQVLSYRNTDQSRRGLVSGGVVSWFSGLSYLVSPAVYYLQGIKYNSLYTILSLDAADATYDRKDIFALDSTGVKIIKGTAAATPLKPEVHPITEIELTYADVTAASTVPIGIMEEVVYNENIEWTGSGSGITPNFAFAIAPYTGSKCTDVGNIGTLNSVVYTKSEVIAKDTYKTLSFFVKLKDYSMGDLLYLVVYFTSNGQIVSEGLIVELNKDNIEWQNYAFKIANFQIRAANYDGIIFKWFVNTGGVVTYSGFYLDYIVLQGGVKQSALEEKIHRELNHLENLTSRTVTIVFETPFNNIPVGVTNLKVWRMEEFLAGTWGVTDVLYDFTSKDWLTTTGFSLHINEMENLTGVIVEYNFTE